ncbi:MAG: hypothetical protein HUJ65_03250, partial [Oscillospiraceae bacterium]|nr:hypothetical protein [Oscillospiraceae bacterium]
ESFDGLDWGKRELMAAVLKRYAEKRNACIVVTSHYLRELRDIADRFLLIKDRTSQELSIAEAEKFFSDDDRRGREKIETLF